MNRKTLDDYPWQYRDRCTVVQVPDVSTGRTFARFEVSTIDQQANPAYVIPTELHDGDRRLLGLPWQTWRDPTPIPAGATQPPGGGPHQPPDGV